MTEVLYLAIVKDLKNKIIKGSILPGEMLKSESEMMKEYSVSRMTLRKSLSLLSNSGYIYSVPGKGYFVKKPENDLYQFHFNSYESLNCEVDTIKLASVDIVFANDDLQKLLNMQDNNKIAMLERVSYCEKTPVALEIVYFPYIKGEPMIEDKLNFASYYKMTETKNTFDMEGELEVQLVNAPDFVAKRLLCNVDEPVVLVAKRIFRKKTSKVISVSKFYIKTPYFSIRAATPRDDHILGVF